MLVLYIILGALVYFMIGGLAAGIYNDDKYLAVFVFAWPIMLLLGLIVGIAYYPYKLGVKLNEKFGGK